MPNVLEGQDIYVKSSVGKRNISTLSQWCKSNGHNGVTQKCILSAMQSQDKKVVSWAKKAVMTNMVKNKDK